MFLKIFGFITLFGLAVAAPGHRVVNGTDANIEDYPFIVSLRSYNSHSCGASILSPDWILTAAHCVGSSTNGVTIQYGTHFISSVGNVIDVERIIRHEKYSPADSYRNDIALLKLKSSIPLGPNAQPTKLPPPFFEVPESSNDCTLIGWGLEKTGGSVQKRLQEVDYFIVTNNECNRIHSSTIHPSNICAAYPGGGKGQCSVSIII